MRLHGCWLAAVLTLVGPARAASGAPSYSPYERRALTEAAAESGHALDPDPEGKHVEAIDIHRLPVFDAHDPAPDWLNMFHATSRDAVIRREVLIPVGEPFRQESCNETARNLRMLRQLSLVLCAATRGTAPNTVRVLIVTKDVWSLRLSWEPVGTLAGLESLRLEPTETNLGGTHQVLRARYIYYPASHALGLGYSAQRLAGTRVSLWADATTFLNRGGDLEGTAGRVVAGQPLYSTKATSGWQVQTAWFDSETRIYKGVRIKTDAHGIPIQYRRRQIQESAAYTLSFGSERKHDVTFGAEMNLRTFRATNTTNAAAEDFAAFMARYVPLGETRVGPFVQYRTYETRFARVWDYDTLGLEENFRLGADVTGRVYPVLGALGSTRDLLGTYVALFYSLPLRDGLIRAGAESTLELGRDGILNGAVQAGLHIASPQLGLGRLVFDAQVLDRYKNGLNRISYLGGDGRLRGYPTSAFAGKSYYVANLEFRTRPVQIFTVQLGGVAFYDLGNAVSSFATLAPRSSIGAGVRVLLPQFDRWVFRVDVAFPLDRTPWPPSPDQPFDPVGVMATFEQAFGPPTPSGTVGAPTSSTAPGPTTGWLGQ